MENLLLLHGALGSASTLTDLKQALSKDFNVITFDFPGHGGKDAEGATTFSIPYFSESILDLLDSKRISQTHIFGYSMGGYVALYFALNHPERVQSIFTLATKFAWSPETAKKEIALLNPDKIALKVPHFAAMLAERHLPLDWKQVMLKTADMMLELGNQPVLSPEGLQEISTPVRLSVGDNDSMVSVEETLQAYRELSKASLLVLPATRHALEQVPVTRLVLEIRQFIQSVAELSVAALTK